VLLLVAFVLGLATVPLAGGDVRALGRLRLRRWPVLATALVLQTVALKAPLSHDTAAILNGVTYLLGCGYLLANLHLPGIWVVTAGTSANAAALLANRGVMPASAQALAMAGLSAGPGGGSRGGSWGGPGSFVNSTVVPHARLSFLGDVFAIPRAWPLHNVFSLGDIL